MKELVAYCLTENPQGALGVLQKNGLPASNMNEAFANFETLIDRYGEDAIEELLEEHPDFPLFELYFISRQQNTATSVKPIDRSNEIVITLKEAVAIIFVALILLILFR